MSKSSLDRHAADILRMTDNFERLSYQFSPPPAEASTASLGVPRTVLAPRAIQLEDSPDGNHVVVDDASATEDTTNPSHPYVFVPDTIASPTTFSSLTREPSVATVFEDVQSDITASYYYSSDRHHIALLEKQMAKLTALHEQQAELLRRTQSQSQPYPKNFLPHEPPRYYAESFPLAYGTPWLPMEYLPTHSPPAMQHYYAPYPSAFVVHPRDQVFERPAQDEPVHPAQAWTRPQFGGGFGPLQQQPQQGDGRQTAGPAVQQQGMPPPVQPSPYPSNRESTERPVHPTQTSPCPQFGCGFDQLQQQPQQGDGRQTAGPAVQQQEMPLPSQPSPYPLHTESTSRIATRGVPASPWIPPENGTAPLTSPKPLEPMLNPQQSSAENHTNSISPNHPDGSPELWPPLGQEILQKTIAQALYDCMRKHQPDLPHEAPERTISRTEYGIVLENHARLSPLREPSNDDTEAQDDAGSYISVETKADNDTGRDSPVPRTPRDSIMYRMEREAAKRRESEGSSSHYSGPRPDPPCVYPSPAVSPAFFRDGDEDSKPAYRQPLSRNYFVGESLRRENRKQLRTSRGTTNVREDSTSTGTIDHQVVSDIANEPVSRPQRETMDTVTRQDPPCDQEVATSMRKIAHQEVSAETTVGSDPDSHPQQERNASATRQDPPSFQEVATLTRNISQQEQSARSCNSSESDSHAQEKKTAMTTCQCPHSVSEVATLTRNVAHQELPTQTSNSSERDSHAHEENIATATQEPSTRRSSSETASRPPEEPQDETTAAAIYRLRSNRECESGRHPGAYRVGFLNRETSSDIDDIDDGSSSDDVTRIEEILITAQVVNESLEEERRNEVDRQLAALQELRSDLERQRATVVHAQEVHIERRRPWWRRLFRSNRKRNESTDH